jgi:hypothetical protein
LAKAKPEAESPKVNKSEEIRDYIRANPKAKNKMVVDALAEKGVKVTPAFVYIIKSKMNKTAKREKRAANVVKTQQMGIKDPVEMIHQVKELARRLGGMGQLKRLVELLEA